MQPDAKAPPTMPGSTRQSSIPGAWQEPRTVGSLPMLAFGAYLFVYANWHPPTSQANGKDPWVNRIVRLGKMGQREAR